MSRIVEIYLAQNLLLLLSWMLVLLTRHLPRQPSARQRLWLAYALLAASVLAPLAAPQRVADSPLPVTAQIWSAAPAHAAAGPAPSSATVSVMATGAQLPLSGLATVFVVFFLGGAAAAVVRISQGVRGTLRVLAEAYTVRRAGALRVLATTAGDVPFSFWLPGRCFIVVPVALLADAARLRLALRHEAQHHRQGDTRWVYALQLLAGVFFVNPSIHFLRRHIREQQELACDAAVVGGGDPQAYCDCLLWIAERTVAQPGLHLTAGMGRTLLRRRVVALLGEPPARLATGTAYAILAALVGTVIMTGLALAGTVQDRRITAAQAQGMAAAAQSGTTFPIVMNEPVLNQLNELLGTPAGRAFTRDSLQRMHQEESVVVPRLEQAGLPLELKAVPLVESGYRNRPQDGNPRHGAGLWMFVAPTARQFGLTVDNSADQRMDAALESDAAVRMLSALYQELGDWRLALLAFNAGDEAVEGAITQEGTRDAFRLTQLGHENDPGYLPRVMAAIIIMKNEDQLSLQ